MVPIGRSRIGSLLELATRSQASLVMYNQGKDLTPTHLSYSELYKLATQRSDQLRNHGAFTPGKIILIHFQNHLDQIMWFWAAVLADCIPAMSTPLVNNTEARISHLNHLHHLLLDPIVITTQELIDSDFIHNDILQIVSVNDLDTCHQIRPKVQQRTSSKDKRTFKSVPRSKCTSDTSEIAVLMLTSGSTGNAKAVCLTHRQIFAAVIGKLSIMPLSSGSALLNWVSLDHAASLVEIHLCAMFAGLDQVHVPAATILADPIHFLRLLSKHNVSRTFAPNFFLAKLQIRLNDAPAKETCDIHLNEQLFIASGGEANVVHTCAEITTSLQKLGVTSKSVIVPGFGMTETCAGAIFNLDCPEVDLEAGTEFASVGICMPGIQMRISFEIGDHFDATNTNPWPSAEGVLEVCGPVVFEKYFNNEKATRDAFTDDGWFITGDLARIDDQGYLRLVGRSKEVINVNGVKYSPGEIESAIDQARIPGVTPSFVACFAYRPSRSSTEKVFIAYQHTFEASNLKSRKDTLVSIVDTVMSMAGTTPRVLPLPPGFLAKSSLGKLSRTKIRSQWEQGLYADQEALNARMLKHDADSCSSQPRDNIDRRLIEIFDNTLCCEGLEINIDTRMVEIGVGSVDMIRLKNACERAFDIEEIAITTIITNDTIRSLANAINQQKQTNRPASEYNPIVTLQPNGSETPLWLVHPGVGEILIFLGLMPYFPNRPLHALRTRGFNQNEQPFASIEEAVTTYHNAIKMQQPRGPYAIAGYSYGSMLAFEIAKLLEANGDTVKFVGNLNLPPHIKARLAQMDWTTTLVHIATFCDLIGESESDDLIQKLRPVSRSKQIATLWSKCDSARLRKLSMTADSLLKWTDVAWSQQKLGMDYEPAGSVEAMDVFCCQPLRAVARSREEYRHNQLSQWADFVRDGVRFHDVPGEHHTMLAPAHVARFQRVLQGALKARGL